MPAIAKAPTFKLTEEIKKNVAETMKAMETTSSAVEKLVSIVKTVGVRTLKACSVLDAFKAILNNSKSTPEARSNVLSTVILLCESVGSPCEPYLVQTLLPVIMDRFADKNQKVRQDSEKAAQAILNITNQDAVRHLLFMLFQGLETEVKWQIKIATMNLIKLLVDSAPDAVRFCIPEIVPVLSDCIWDTKTEVCTAATEALTKVCSVIGNPDIEIMITRIIGCICRPEEVPECIHALAATTFVKTVEAPTLAIMAPLLMRGLDEPSTVVKRQAAVIIDNMCKLVEDPSAVEQLIPKVLPKLDRIIEIQADPECRNMTTKARATLVRVGGNGVAHIKTVEEIKQELHQAEHEAFTLLKADVAKNNVKIDEDALSVLEYICSISCFLSARMVFTETAWVKSFQPYLTSFMSEADASKVCKSFLETCIQDIARKNPVVVEEEEEGEDLCDCEFSLAYGGMVLLNSARLRLKRGHRYGLCGPNGSGKTTLMKAIAEGKLDGFPSADVLRTVYVAHELQGAEIMTLVKDFITTDPRFITIPLEEVHATLKGVGFDDEMLLQTVDSLSGGWKMKLELARAMIMRADILLMDEPTNHLDVKNVAWLENYLNGLKDVTCILVSHDSSFLDNVCTNIIHYENRKLKAYRGNLSEFVKVKPEAKAYYELAETQFKFSFPEPGFLEGVNSKDKAILKMKNCNFAYPGATRYSIMGMSVQASLSSRISIKGPNGAGKSTLVKLLTGELIPSDGDVWKHPNLRVAYVAQHAFHHLEKHLEMTPNQYIQWRYQYGEDRELLNKESRKLTDEEKALLAKPIVIEGEKRIFEQLFGRRKLKTSYEYEVKWANMHYDDNTWHSRKDIENWGFSKILQQYDDKEAALAGTYKRALTVANIEAHLLELGLEAEFATHRHIKGLSGGQKVKTVLAAAMWDHPHILVLDEPTNYLDRDSLGALSNAIKEFQGGVVMITHHQEFSDALCTEVWNVDSGRIFFEGEAIVSAEKIEWKAKEEKKDAFGNVEKVTAPTKQKLSRKEQKEKDRRKKNAKKNGMAVQESEDEDDF